VRHFWSYYFGWYQGNVWPNLAASAVTGSLAAAFTVWRMRLHHQRTRDENREHRESIRAEFAEHHDAARVHLAAQLGLRAAAQDERLDVITDQIAALHAKLDQQQGGAP